YFLILLLPPTSTLFPYTTLFRSQVRREFDLTPYVVSSASLPGGCDNPRLPRRAAWIGALALELERQRALLPYQGEQYGTRCHLRRRHTTSSRRCAGSDLRWQHVALGDKRPEMAPIRL